MRDSNAIQMPVPTSTVSVPTTTSNKKLTQKWINFGIVYDKNNLETSDAGFCAAGYGTPADDLEALRKKLVRGTKQSRAVYNGLVNMHQYYTNLLQEGGQSEYQIIGSLTPESERKATVEEILNNNHISEELKAQILSAAFPEGPKWAIQYHRQGIKQESEDSSFVIPTNRL